MAVRIEENRLHGAASRFGGLDDAVAWTDRALTGLV
jgi:hypothetical protein